MPTALLDWLGSWQHGGKLQAAAARVLAQQGVKRV
jgi:hypothetical protein